MSCSEAGKSSVVAVEPEWFPMELEPVHESNGNGEAMASAMMRSPGPSELTERQKYLVYNIKFFLNYWITPINKVHLMA